MAWVQWDNETDTFQGMIRSLPDTLEGRDSASLALLGIRELLIVQPEDYIARFPMLLGRSVFTRMPDGRVKQTFPEADFSVAAVRAELTRQMKEAAGRELQKTDWYVVRSYEQNRAIPDDVTELRGKIRDHTDALEDEIKKIKPRQLVDFQWKFPQAHDEVMVNGLPVKIAPTPPPPVPDTPTPPDEHPTGEGLDPDADGVWGTTELAPAPPAPPEYAEPPAIPATTDGPIPMVGNSEDRPHLDANGIPLVTVYAPNVEDTGPRPANN